MIRIKELWRTRKQKRARINNEQLARADQQIPSQLDRWDRPTAGWSPEMLDRLDAMLKEPGEYGDASS